MNILILGFNLDTWNLSVQSLLMIRGALDELENSEEDCSMPYFATKTLCYGILEGSLADVAMLRFFCDECLGQPLRAYVDRALELCLGTPMNWDAPETEAAMSKLRNSVN